MNRNLPKTHIDLFSGIGGFALACQWSGIKTVQFCEIDPFCQKVLNKNFPGVPIHDDIKTFHWTGDSPFILTGGFPCQPFSCAGQRKGSGDDRYLWPEMLRVISEAGPTWVVGENVNGITSMVLTDNGIEVDEETSEAQTGERTNVLVRCITDLESLGYEVQTFCIPACAVGAPHRRDRIWIVAHSTSNGCGCRGYSQRGVLEGEQPKDKEQSGDRRTGEIGGMYLINFDNAGNPKCQRLPESLCNQEPSRRIQQEPDERHRVIEPSDIHVGNTESITDRFDTPEHERRENHTGRSEPNCHASHSQSNGLQERGMARYGNKERLSIGDNVDVYDAQGVGLQGSIITLRGERPEPHDEQLHGCCGEWSEPWIEVATRFCRVDDGVSDRVHRLKGLGNAIVPQVAYEIIKAIVKVNE